MSYSVSFLYKIVDEMTPVINKMNKTSQKAFKGTEKQIECVNKVLNKTKAELPKVSQKADVLGSKLKKSGNSGKNAYEKVNNSLKKVSGNTSKAISKTARLSAMFSKVGQRLKTTGRAMMTKGALITAPLVAGTMQAHAFNKGLAEIATLVPKMGIKRVEKEFGSLALSISDKFGIATKDVNQAMYQAISAGVEPSRKALEEFLTVSAQSAVGGVTSIAESVDGITSVLNAYGKETINTTQIVDSMFTAMKDGKTTIPEISKFLFQAVPTASKLGITFDEVMGSLVAITKQGTPTRVAMTQIRSAFNELSQSGSKVDKIFRVIAGKSFLDFKKEGGGLQEAIAMISNYADKANVPVKNMFNSIEAGNFAMMMTGEGAKHFGNAMVSLANKTGAGQKAFEDFSDSDAFMVTQQLNKLRNASLKAFRPMLNLLAKYIEKAEPAINKTVKWIEKNDKLIGKILIAAGAIGVFLTVGGGFLMVIGTASSLLGILIPILSTVIGLLWAMIAPILANPITWVVLAIVGAIYVLYKALQGLVFIVWWVVHNWDKVWFHMKNIVMFVVDGWIEMFSLFKEYFLMVIDIFTGNWESAFNRLKNIYDRTIGKIITSVSNFWGGGDKELTAKMEKKTIMENTGTQSKNYFDVSGQIGVTASNGAQVEYADFGDLGVQVNG